MKTKKLYIVTKDCGDGSNALEYTFERDAITALENQYNEGDIDECYMSGDGLQVDELNVPVSCTYDSLGISKYAVLEVEESDMDEDE